MTTKRPFQSKLDCEEVFDMYRRGISDCEIARTVQCHQTTVLAWRRKRGLPTNEKSTHSGQSIVMTDAEKRKAKRMLLAGCTKEQVATAIGRSAGTIQRLRRTLGDDPRLRKAAQKVANSRKWLERDLGRILAQLKRATRHVTDPMLRDDVIGEMTLALLEDRLKPDQIAAQAKAYSGRAYGLWQSPFGPASLNKEIGEDGFTLGDAIACPKSLEWVEEMGG